MNDLQSNGFVPDVDMRFKEFASMQDPGQRMASTIISLKRALHRCESPIEQLLFIEITRILTEFELTPFCAIHPQIWAYYTQSVDNNLPAPTKVVGVRLDFLVNFENKLDYFRSDHTDLLPLDCRPSFLPLFAVECDGRDFHTHERAIQRDKARDRALTSLGLTTIRFTGTEISNDPRSCAGEIFNLFLVRFREILDHGVDRREFVDYHYRVAPLPGNIEPSPANPPRLSRFKHLYLSEREHVALLQLRNTGMISDAESRELGLTED